MKLARLTALALLAAPLVVEAQPGTPPSWTAVIKSPKRSVSVSADSRVATVEGRWKKVNPATYVSTTMTINTVRVVCSLDTHRCRETIGYVYSKDLDGDRFGASQDGELGVLVHEYEIREWSENRISAVKDMPVATLELRIFPGTRTADQIWAERQDPKVFNRYVLD